tara:strand:+ start:491 stop:1552 length:1062 start_codon:yes stop_codon:yes gene_type:complete
MLKKPLRQLINVWRFGMLVRSEEKGEVRFVLAEYTRDVKCLCGQGDGTVVGDTDRHGIPTRSVLCDCGLVRIDPYYETSDLDEFYQEHYRQEFRDFEEQWDIEVQRGGGIQAEIPVDWGSAIEYGAGLGGVSYIVGSQALEPNKECRAYGESQGVAYIDQMQECDLLILSHVLEHFPDPVAKLKELKQYAKKYLYVVVPGLAQIPRSYNTSFQNYAEDAHPWSFCFETAKWVVEEAGFRVLWGSEAITLIAIREEDVGRICKPDEEPYERTTPHMGPRIEQYLGAVRDMEWVMNGYFLKETRKAEEEFMADVFKHMEEEVPPGVGGEGGVGEESVDGGTEERDRPDNPDNSQP